VDALVNAPGSPNGVSFSAPGQPAVALEAPTLSNVKTARTRWLAGATADDILIFYCCGHGIGLPSVGQTFLAADFGADPENPWSNAIDLDSFPLGLGEKAPRRQWLIFDCCSNTPPVALKALAANPDPLLAPQVGGLQQAEDLYGMLSQVILFATTPGAQAFGKDTRASRFMEAFLEACDTSAFVTQDEAGLWWADQQTMNLAIWTYAERVAPEAEQSYFTFPRLVQCQAPNVPRLLKRSQNSMCTLLVRSKPPIRLTEGNLTIMLPPLTVLGGQVAGATAEACFRLQVVPWETYACKAEFPEESKVIQKTALPPLTKVEF
jgi:hypothetical protein